MLLSLLTSESRSIAEILMYLVSALCVIFLILPVHEFAHGFVATKLGDYTPRMQGRLTLNPMAHIDYMGALFTLILGFGWAKPVQVNARNFKSPKWGMAVTALAGPISNIICAFISMVLVYTCFLFVEKINDVWFLLADFFSFLAQMNVYLAVFNLIPIPPFDGSRILFSLLPTKYYFAVMKYERYILIALMVLLVVGVFDGPLALLTNGLLRGISHLVSLVFGLFV